MISIYIDDEELYKETKRTIDDNDIEGVKVFRFRRFEDDDADRIYIYTKNYIIITEDPRLYVYDDINIFNEDISHVLTNLYSRNHKMKKIYMALIFNVEFDIYHYRKRFPDNDRFIYNFIDLSDIEDEDELLDKLDSISSRYGENDMLFLLTSKDQDIFDNYKNLNVYDLDSDMIDDVVLFSS